MSNAGQHEMNIVLGSVYPMHDGWGEGGQLHLVEGCLNAEPCAGVVTRLACMCTAV